MSAGNGIGHGLGYRYNVARIDPCPFQKRLNDRADEIGEQFPPDRYRALLLYVAEKELAAEGSPAIQRRVVATISTKGTP